ncbi:hypothetical protein EVAR_22685_1 [Eumeta japonica]|uniref:Uncharacterized protein n=1 Tax=Eumeta variegata TaxID=151549 RepID=A0A4C1US83_EUMVA|nr:hypothetical protein EVAR_22685_1 [Eumeta japonica]
METDIEPPINLGGDFNSDVYQNQSVLRFMKEECKLEGCQSHQTTRRNAYLDLFFTTLLMDKRVREPPEHRWSPSPMDTHDSGGVTSALGRNSTSLRLLAMSKQGRKSSRRRGSGSYDDSAPR